MLGTAPAQAEEPRKPLVFGVFAYLGVEQTRAMYAPLVDYLNATLREERVVLRILPQDELQQAISRRDLDIVTTNPTHFLVTRKQYPLTGVIATLVTSEAGEPVHQLGGAIITRAERQDIQQLRDLRDRVIATPSLQHMGGYRAQAYELHLAGLQLPRDARRVDQLKTHQAVVRAVLAGQADVGFVRDGIIEHMEQRGELPPARLKVINAQYHANFPHIVSTRLYPEWPVFALPHVPEKSVRHVAAALFALEPEHPAARAAGIHGYTIPADYLMVEEMARALRLPPFEHPPEITWRDIWNKWRVGLLIAAVALAVILLLGGKLALMSRRARRHDAHTRRLLETLGEGVYGTDLAGRCTFINRAALDMLGLTEKEVLDRNQHALFHYRHEDGRPYPQDTCPIQHTCQDGVSRRSEEWFTRKDGSGFPVEQVVSPLMVDGRLVGSVVAFQDISARRAAEREHTRLMQRNTLLLDSAGDGIFGTDDQGRCTFINPAALAMLGYQEHEVIGQDQHQLFHHRHPDGHPYPHAECPIQRTLLDGMPRETEENFIHKDGHVIPVHLKITPMVELEQRIGVEVVFQDFTQRKALEAKLVELASTDGLTGLANRRHFMEILEHELGRVRRYGKSAALLMLDLDHFKAINDRYGHAAGDEVLRAFAAAGRAELRRIDLAGRLGGEEFAILLPQTEPDAARTFAERLRHGIADLRVTVAGQDIGFTVSIGCAALLPSDPSIDVALARADAALYQAKANGRDRIESAA